MSRSSRAGCVGALSRVLSVRCVSHASPRVREPPWRRWATLHHRPQPRRRPQLRPARSTQSLRFQSHALTRRHLRWQPRPPPRKLRCQARRGGRFSARTLETPGVSLVRKPSSAASAANSCCPTKSRLTSMLNTANCRVVPLRANQSAAASGCPLFRADCQVWASAVESRRSREP